MKKPEKNWVQLHCTVLSGSKSNCLEDVLKWPKRAAEKPARFRETLSEPGMELPDLPAGLGQKLKLMHSELQELQEEDDACETDKSNEEVVAFQDGCSTPIASSAEVMDRRMDMLEEKMSSMDDKLNSILEIVSN